MLKTHAHLTGTLDFTKNKLSAPSLGQTKELALHQILFWACFSLSELLGFNDRELSFAGMRNEPYVQVNLSPERIPVSQAVNGLRDFFLGLRIR